MTKTLRFKLILKQLVFRISDHVSPFALWAGFNIGPQACSPCMLQWCRISQSSPFVFIHTSNNCAQAFSAEQQFSETKKMAQALAMPLAPSLSLICNGLISNPLSNRVSFPITNPSKV